MGRNQERGFKGDLNKGRLLGPSRLTREYEIESRNQLMRK
jgi:hypothetical protein